MRVLVHIDSRDSTTVTADECQEFIEGELVSCSEPACGRLILHAP